jgi:hypothetical protein
MMTHWPGLWIKLGFKINWVGVDHYSPADLVINWPSQKSSVLLKNKKRYGLNALKKQNWNDEVFDWPGLIRPNRDLGYGPN